MHMGFIIFVIVAFMSGGAMENPGGGFCIGILSWILYAQGKRIKALEMRHMPASISPKPSLIEPKLPPLQEPTPAIQIEIPKLPKEEPSIQKPKPTPISAPRAATPNPVVTFFTTGNPIARIGAVILFFGVGFALKFAAEEGYFPPEIRLILAALFSIILLGLGWKIRNQKKQFAVTLQGTGIGIFYITTFIAYKMYHYIPATMAFGFFLAITVLSGVIAVACNARSIAVLAMVGGFLAPILSSEGGGSHIMLFSYIAMLNAGIFAMCWFRSWRALNLTGFLFTFFIAASWADGFYHPELYESCQFFLILFAVTYTGINVLYSVKQPEGGTVDTLMTFGTPLLYSLLQWKLVQPFEYGTAISSASFGAFHILLARILFSMYSDKLRMLVESYLTIGLILVTLAVPFTFDSSVSSAIWALEAAALIWNGIRQGRLGTRVLGILLLPLSAVLFLSEQNPYYGEIAFFNHYFMGIVLLTTGHLISGALLIGAPEGAIKADERQLGRLSLWCAGFWWFFGGWAEVTRHISQWHTHLQGIFESAVWTDKISLDTASHSLFTTLSVIGFWLYFNRYKLPGKTTVYQFLVPIQTYLLLEFSTKQFFSYVSPDVHLFAIPGIFAWTLFFAVHYFLLYRAEQEKQILPWQHRFGLWLFIYVITWELSWVAERYAAIGWNEGALVAIPALYTLIVCSKIRAASTWPYATNKKTYCEALWLPVWWSMIASFTFDIISSCPTAPLPYVPLLNVQDIAQAAAVLALVVWMKRLSDCDMLTSAKETRNYAILGGWSFVWATSTLLRTIHHWMGIRWSIDAMFDSNFVQAALSIFWTVLALTLMVLSHRKGWRQLWKTGAVLIGIVVIKLFIIDLSNQATLGRIAAFLGVGVLMLSIGYLAPIPPEKKDTVKKQEEA